MSERKINNEEQLAEHFNDSYGTLVVYFHASWCGPCGSIEPKVKQLYKTSGINVAKVNADENPELVKKYQVNAMPTFTLLFDNIDNSVMSVAGADIPKIEQMFAKAKHIGIFNSKLRNCRKGRLVLTALSDFGWLDGGSDDSHLPLLYWDSNSLLQDNPTLSNWYRFDQESASWYFL